MNRFKTPRGSIPDLRYLYVIISALGRKNDHLSNDKSGRAYLIKNVNDYNESKFSAFSISRKPREVKGEVISNALSELVVLELIERSKDQIALTKKGKVVAELIKQKNSHELKRKFASILLERYPIFEFFLKRLEEVAGINGLFVPMVTAEVFEEFEGDFRIIAENYVKTSMENSPLAITSIGSLYSTIEDERLNLATGKPTSKLDKLQTIIEKFVISETFDGIIKSRRTYDYLRSRTTFLELTNYGVFDLAGNRGEVLYLTSSFTKKFPYTASVVYGQGTLYGHETLYINYPSFKEIRFLFKESLLEVYHQRKDEFGYMMVADLRDAVCRQLKISDGLFDNYIKILSREESRLLSFTYGSARDKITEKRLPIVFDKPNREIYTLIRITSPEVKS